MTARGFFQAGFCVILLSLAAAPRARAEEEESPFNTVDYVTVRKQQGVSFTLPEDWPIEKKKGTIGPVAVEEYVAMKFSKMNEKIAGLEARIAKLEAAAAKPNSSGRRKVLGIDETVAETAEPGEIPEEEDENE